MDLIDEMENKLNVTYLRVIILQIDSFEKIPLTLFLHRNCFLFGFRNGNMDVDFSDLVRIPETAKINNVSTNIFLVYLCK